ncbi:hypothetical protein Fot_12144 [Forsythia ovata]|uniref:Uncharacterized protein n=1 Tax=Forsythia ovata TaxID=205694 RepID=A0ABD1WLQ4_9LAMI
MLQIADKAKNLISLICSLPLYTNFDKPQFLQCVSEERVKTGMSEFISASEMPFTFADDVYFEEFKQKYVQPSYRNYFELGLARRFNPIPSILSRVAQLYPSIIHPVNTTQRRSF